MSPKRVFRGHPDRLDQVYRVAPAGSLHDDELGLFLQEARKILPDQHFRLMEKLAHMPPARRLAVNLKSLADIMAEREVTDVAQDGLTEKERGALIELHRRGATPRVRQIASALLAVEERSDFVGYMGRCFKDLVTRKGGYIQNGRH